MVKLQAHRGVSCEYPENTMPAFLAAIEQGYEAIELDVEITLDKKLVVLHDRTVNRTARRADGTKIEATLPACYATYEQLLEYDFGIGYNKKFAGTKIPLLEDVLALAKKHGISVKIDSKYIKMTDEAKSILFELLKSYTDVASLTVDSIESLKEARERFPSMSLHFDGVTDTDTVLEAASLIPADMITFWLPYPNEKTAFSKLPKISKELAETVKKHGKLGVWNLVRRAEFEEACAFGADIVETNGQIKHEMNKGFLTDIHTHSENSHDAKFPIVQFIEKAMERELDAFAVTDHCDIFLCEDDRELDVYSNLKKAFEEVTELNKTYGDRCLTLTGVELGDGIWHPDICKKVTDFLPYDVVIGAVHAVKCSATAGGVGMKRAFSQLKYNELPKHLFDELMKNYFDDMLTMVETLDIDVMAHIICPLGYPLHRHKIYIDARPYEPMIEKILATIIKKGIAFEVNPMLCEVVDGERPYLWIVKKFYDMGGHMIVFSTDAHSPGGVGAGFVERAELMKEIGLDTLYYFKNRKAIPCKL